MFFIMLNLLIFFLREILNNFSIKRQNKKDSICRPQNIHFFNLNHNKLNKNTLYLTKLCRKVRNGCVSS
jgi:hypothetical protein